MEKTIAKISIGGEVTKHDLYGDKELEAFVSQQLFGLIARNKYEGILRLTSDEIRLYPCRDISVETVKNIDWKEVVSRGSALFKCSARRIPQGVGFFSFTKELSQIEDVFRLIVYEINCEIRLNFKGKGNLDVVEDFLDFEIL